MTFKSFHEKNFPGVTVRSAATYAILPGVIPRLNRIAVSIRRTLFTFVQLLGLVGLIDKNHPCLRIENSDQYPFSHILIYAWQNLKFNRRNIPQIAFFFAVCLTLLLVCGIVLAFLVQILFYVNTSHAQYFYFQTPNNADTGVIYDKNFDWIFLFLERIFGDTGVMDFWTDKGANPAAVATNPWFTAIFGGMLKAYSNAIFSLAAFMILYIIIMAVAEAAKTGKPFGKTFDGVWAPIRMAICLFLLAPIPASNYNAAQLLVFQSAEWGNNLANNIWLRTIHAMVVEDAAQQNPSKKKENANFIGMSNVEPGYRFVRDVFLIHLCMKGYDLITCSLSATPVTITPIVATDDSFVTYQFGIPEAPTYCGSIVFPAPMIVPEGAPGNDAKSKLATDFLPNKIIDGYSVAVANLVSIDGSMSKAADKIVAAFTDNDTADFGKFATATDIKAWIDDYRKVAFGLGVDGKNYGAYNTQSIAYNRWIVNSMENDAKFGWGTAGVFYLRMTNAIAMANRVVQSPPSVNKYPTNFTRMYATPSHENLGNKNGRELCQLKDRISDPGSCDAKSTPQRLYALLDKGNDWFTTQPVADPTIYAELGGAHFTDQLRVVQKQKAEESRDESSLFSMISGSLYDMAKLSVYDLHPLGTVINWGQTFMQTAFAAYLIAITAGYLAGAIKAMTFGILNIGSPVSLIAEAVGHLFLIPGFILAFIVPFIPTFYFMFAVLEWIISIVEAVIAMPLWALSFLTAQGDLFGSGANGVKSLFEIILRPMIIVASLVFAIVIFTAGITFINDSYALFMGAYDDATQTSMGPVSSIVAGIGSALLYMFAVYTYATTCFKLIDVLPDRFTEWLKLPAGFNTKIRAGHQDIKADLVEAAAIRRLFSQFTGFAKKIGRMGK